MTGCSWATLTVCTECLVDAAVARAQAYMRFLALLVATHVNTYASPSPTPDVVSS